MRGKLRSFSIAAVILTAASTLVVQSSVVGAAVPTRAAAPAGNLARNLADSAKVLTLITGDRVTVTRMPGGEFSTSVKPGPGRGHVVFSSRTVDGHVHVTPADARPLLDAGLLDPRLFDITQLTEWEYDDARTASLPLVVTGAGARTAATDAARAARTAGAMAVKGAEVTRQLASVGGVAVNESKQDATAFWEALTGATPARTAKAKAPQAFAVAGVGKVWLNGRSRILDEQSNAQIGVPAARAAGYDGRGVTVAVLDTGIDVNHPDLASVLGETKDFTNDPDGVKDEVGHGTHVAGIIAGTGTQNAAYEGVAPRATIMMGRVCGTYFCDDDAVLAGMEWAAGKAKVVNLSLGGRAGDDGTDVKAQAANALSASTGTLFVASAGNSYFKYTVASPASADAVLAVASVGRTDAVSDFSSKGPRGGNHAIKPDIAAPGEDIVAARAAGTTLGSPVGQHYVTASGTSMSSPHVAGVAALLVQAHPDWTPDRLKAVLMSSSGGPVSLKVFEAGAGRVDAARAIAQTVYTDGNLSFPYVAWPRTAPLTKSVTYHNTGTAAVTLNLALSDAGAGFNLGASALTVPAGGSTQTTVTLDPVKLPTSGGLVGTHLIATADGIAVRTAVGAAAEPESYNVDFTLVDRNGKPASGEAEQDLFLNPYLSEVDGISARLVDGKATVRMQKGDWHIHSFTTTPGDEASGRKSSITMEVVSKYTVDRDGLQLTLDARAGARSLLSVADRPEAVIKDLGIVYTIRFGGKGGTGSLSTDGSVELFAVPTTTAPGTGLRYSLTAQYGSPAAEPKPYSYYLATTGPENTIPVSPVWTVRTAELARRDVKLLARGKLGLAEIERAPFSLGDSIGREVTVALPSTRTDYLSPQVGWNTHLMYQRPADRPNPVGQWGLTFDTSDLDGAGAAGMRRSEEWNTGTFGPSFAIGGFDAFFVNDFVVRSGDGIFVRVPMFSPANPNQVTNSIHQLFTVDGQTSLTREGQAPDVYPYGGLADFYSLPAAEARYTLSTTATRIDWVPWTDLTPRIDASWTFRSKASEEEITFLPLMYLRTTGPFDDLNRGPAGRPFVLSVEVLRQENSGPASKVKSVTVEYSTDDGATWKKALTLGHGNKWRALVANPVTGFVSLRTSVADAAGDTHSTTVIRAYGVR